MAGLFSIVPLIIVFPFVGMLINVFLGRRLVTSRASLAPGVIASIMAGCSFVVALLMWGGLLAAPNGAQVPVFTWMSIPAGERSLTVQWAFQVDTLSVVMMLVVTGVGTLIHVYAIGYMHGDVEEQIAKRQLGDEEALDFKRRRFSRFFTYLNLFLGSMLILVTGNNYLVMFVGWELVGLCSYLLIGFWFDDPLSGLSNSAAGRKAFVVNRIGDFGMVVGLMLIFWTFGTLQFGDVFLRAECMKTSSQAECLKVDTTMISATAQGAPAEGQPEGAVSLSPSTPVSFGFGTLPLGTVVTVTTLLLLLGATGKSAQIPLFIWLPDAMAGPTPVSALIHAATMVTAGIYMITRSNVLFSMAPFSAGVVATIGALTAFVAATIAVAQFDIKKVLAYSTISQLGFMIAAVGLGGYVAGIFHLATHAFFKALLFLSAGSVIHGMEHGHHATAHHAEGEHGGHEEHSFDPQDMRNMGGLARKMPVTAWVYIIGALTLAGIVPLAGFWSKDEILLDASKENPLVYGLLVIAAFFTAFYMGRQVWMVFFGVPRTEAAGHAHESPPLMTVPLIILAALSVLGGLMNLPFAGLNGLAVWLQHTVTSVRIEPEFSLTVAGISTVLALVAIGLSYVVYAARPLAAGQRDPLAASGPLFAFLNHKWFWDDLYAAVFVRGYTALGRVLADVIDWRFWHDYVHDTLVAQGFYQGLALLISRPIDQGLVDGAVNGVGRLVTGSSSRLRRTQTGYVRNYALAVALGVVIILAYLIVRFLR